MDKHIHRISISQLPDAEVPAGLRTAILTKIFMLRRRATIIRTTMLTGTAAISCVLLGEMITYVTSEATASGFMEYSRLLATDSDVALSLWREFGTAVLSSAPLVPVALVCAAAIMLIWSLEHLYQNVRLLKSRSHSHHTLART